MTEKVGEVDAERQHAVEDEDEEKMGRLGAVLEEHPKGVRFHQRRREHQDASATGDMYSSRLSESSRSFSLVRSKP